MPPVDRPPLRHARRDQALLFAAGLAACAVAAVFIRQPGYADAYYYFTGAAQLARGAGFSEPYVWNYLSGLAVAQGAPGPWPSHLYWMPLASIVAAPFMAAAGALSGGQALPNAALFRAAQIPFALLAAALPLLSYQVAALSGGGRRHALAAGALTLFTPFYFNYWPNIDTFALHALAAAGAMLAVVRAQGSRRARLWLLAAGLLAGLAHLARADGLLVLLALLAWLMLRRAAPVPAGSIWRAGLLLLAGYLLAMTPWLARNLLLTGAPLGPGGLLTLWLTDYNDYFTFAPETLAPARYFGLGLPAIARLKLEALAANTATFIGVQTGIVAFPFVVLGLWRKRRERAYGPAALYALALFALMTFVFSFPGARGGYLHSGAALLPFLTPAAIAGLDAVVGAAARRLPHWRPERARPIFTALLVLLVMALAGAVYMTEVIGPDWRDPLWDQRDRVYAQAGQWLAQAGQGGALAAVNNPPAWHYHTGQESIVIPNGGVDTLLAAMAAFDARWLVLDANYPAGLADLYARPDSQPALLLRHSLSGAGGLPVHLLERAGAP